MANPSEVLRSRKTMLDYDMLQQQFDLMKQKVQAQRDMTGKDPAVVQIANKMASARQIMGSAAPGSPEYVAAQNMLDDLMIAGKMMDKGVLAPMGADWRGMGGGAGVPTQGFEAPQFTGPNNPPSLPAAFDGLEDDPEAASRQAILQQQSVTGVNPYQRPELAGTRVIPGYAQSTGSIAATKKGMETQAQKDVELDMNPEIAKQTKLAEQRAQAEFDLPNREGQAEKTYDLIDRISNHPGLGAVVGAGNPFLGKIPGVDKAIPGTDAADFLALQDQLKGSGFLEAVQQMKGMGALSDKEGEAATKAFAALSTSQSEAQYRENLGILKDTINKGVMRAYQRAGMQQPEQPPVNQGPAKGAVEDGYMYLGGDPSQQSSWKKVR